MARHFRNIVKSPSTKDHQSWHTTLLIIRPIQCFSTEDVLEAPKMATSKRISLNYIFQMFPVFGCPVFKCPLFFKRPVLDYYCTFITGKKCLPEVVLDVTTTSCSCPTNRYFVRCGSRIGAFSDPSPIWMSCRSTGSHWILTSFHWKRGDYLAPNFVDYKLYKFAFLLLNPPAKPREVNVFELKMHNNMSVRFSLSRALSFLVTDRALSHH